MKTSRSSYILGIVLIGVMLATFAVLPNQNQTENVPLSAYEYARVGYVIDGDTIELIDGRRIRYIGMDAPEIDFENHTESCLAKNSRIANEKMVIGKEVKMVKDVSDTDSYGRLLRYVYTDGVFVNNELVLKGHAKVMTIPPDTSYKETFQKSQQLAVENGVGVWSDKCQPYE